MESYTFSSSDTNAFAGSYVDARKKFLTAKDMSTLVCEQGLYRPNPTNPDHITDWAMLGAPNAKNILVLISGTHGVEGFAGSAIQTALLRKLAHLPKNTAVLLIHALNPFGFAELRRCNHEGIDLNRNFIDFNQDLPNNPQYLQLQEILVPRTFSQWHSADQALLNHAENSDVKNLETMIAYGQYSSPDGLFYGGSRPSNERKFIESIIAQIADKAPNRVVVIDIHTGLGPFGYGELISEFDDAHGGLRWAKKTFGESVTQPSKGTSCSTPKVGLIDFAWDRVLGERSTFLTLEFGTYPTLQALHALRRDHCLYIDKYCKQPSKRSIRIKKQIKKAFYPATTDWKESVIFRGQQVISQALSGLSEK